MFRGLAARFAEAQRQSGSDRSFASDHTRSASATRRSANAQRQPAKHRSRQETRQEIHLDEWPGGPFLTVRHRTHRRCPGHARLLLKCVRDCPKFLWAMEQGQAQVARVVPKHCRGRPPWRSLNRTSVSCLLANFGSRSLTSAMSCCHFLLIHWARPHYRRLSKSLRYYFRLFDDCDQQRP
jgi:hypothetical protein